MVDVWARLEPHLASVQKPARYIGCELGAEVPSPAPHRVGWLLVYPDTYEVGLPNQGLQILYEILNERDDAVAERSYAPWTDLEEVLRRRGDPPVLGGHPPQRRRVRRAGLQPVGRARLHERPELHRPGRRARAGRGPPGRPPADRRRRATATYNPEPLADFLDFVVLGDGEEVVGEITEAIAAWKQRGTAATVSTCCGPWPASKASTSRSCTTATYLPDGRLEADHPHRPGRACPGREAHHRRPRRVAVPEAPARAPHRGGPRPPQRRGLPRAAPVAAGSARRG